MLVFIGVFAWPGLLAQAQSGEADATKPLLFSARHLVYDPVQKTITAEGGVTITSPDQHWLKAEKAQYNHETGEASAQGEVVLFLSKSGKPSTHSPPPGLYFFADSITIDNRFHILDSKNVALRNEGAVRMTARSLRHRPGARTILELEKASFSTCEICLGTKDTDTDGDSEGTSTGTSTGTSNRIGPTWALVTERGVLDIQTSDLTLYHARWYVLGMPAGYLPIYYQPIHRTGLRRPGFVFPIIGNENDLGLYASPWFFLPLGPSQDISVASVLNVEQIPALTGRYRKVTSYGEAEITGSAVLEPGEDPTPETAETSGEALGHHGRLVYQYDLPDGWRTQGDLTTTSSKQYLPAYGFPASSNQLATNPSTTHLYNRARLEKFSPVQWMAWAYEEDFPQGTGEVNRTEIVQHPQFQHDHRYGLGPHLLRSRGRLERLTAYRDPQTPRTSRTSEQERGSQSVQLQFRPIQLGAMQIRNEIGFTAQYQKNHTETLVARENEQTEETRLVPYGFSLVSWQFWRARGDSIQQITPSFSFYSAPEDVKNQRFLDENATPILRTPVTLHQSNRYAGTDRLEAGTRWQTSVESRWSQSDGSVLKLMGGVSVAREAEVAETDTATDIAGENEPLSTEAQLTHHGFGGYETERFSTGLILESLPDQTAGLGRLTAAGSVTLHAERQARLGVYYYDYRAERLFPDTDTRYQKIQMTYAQKIARNWHITLASAANLARDFKPFDESTLFLRYEDACLILKGSFEANRIEEGARENLFSFRVEVKTNV